MTILLKPMAIATIDVGKKERMIQSGSRHYSEMLATEPVPDERYLTLYHNARARNAGRLRLDIATLARAVAARAATGRTCVIISLARAGTPVGVLLKRALGRMSVEAHHYSISIIRDRGIDQNALRHIAARHDPDTAIFVDGWTGKGAIKRELVRSLAEDHLGFPTFLAVVADPAGCADLAATVDDYVIPSGLLNGIVSGLISRSVLRHDLVGPTDFHACHYPTADAADDLTRDFIRDVEGADVPEIGSTPWSPSTAARANVRSRALMTAMMAEFAIQDPNRIKPGIAEATRAMLRRVPEMLFVRDLDDPETKHLLHLAAKLDVPIRERELHAYRAATLIGDVGR